MASRPNGDSADRMKDGVSTQQNGDRPDHCPLCIVQNGSSHHDDMSPESGIKGDLAHIALETSPFYYRLPPRGLPVKVFHLWNGTDDQRPLLISHQNTDVIRFADIVPSDEVVRDDAINEKGKLALLISLTPTLLPILDHALDAARILPLIRAIGLGDSGMQKGGRGELLSLIHPPTDLHFDATSRFDGRFLEIDAGHFSKRASFLDVGNGEQKCQGQKSDQHDRCDDLALETMRATPECHGCACDNLPCLNRISLSRENSEIGENSGPNETEVR